MSRHLYLQIERLKKQILKLGALVEESVQAAIDAVRSRDAKLAQQVIARDSRIDDMELEVEEECLHTLALHQPVAQDLRYVVSVLKMNNDLERIGDLAVSLAERVPSLITAGIHDLPFDLDAMAEHVQTMLKHSLDALVNVDAPLARSVLDTDDLVDQMHREMYLEVDRRARAGTEDVESLLLCMSVSRGLERIADHATNIAEDVLYMAKGDIVRHSRPVDHHV
jgi:phosphate transport system protein